MVSYVRVLWTFWLLAIAVGLYGAKRMRDAWAVGKGYDSPWSIPSSWWSVPYIPVRILMRTADGMLFRLWWWTRPAEYWLADQLDLDPVIRDWKRRQAVNAELNRRDELGIAPDGGFFLTPVEELALTKQALDAEEDYIDGVLSERDEREEWSFVKGRVAGEPATFP